MRFARDCTAAIGALALAATLALLSPGVRAVRVAAGSAGGASATVAEPRSDPVPGWALPRVERPDRDPLPGSLGPESPAASAAATAAIPGRVAGDDVAFPARR